MRRDTKALFLFSLISLILSYPACHYGERKALSEMAKYPPDFVAAHQFDLIFARWIVPGIGLFFLAGALAFAGLVAWLVERRSRKDRV